MTDALREGRSSRPSVALNAAWREWIARNLLKGVSDRRLREMLVSRGFGHTDVDEALGDIVAHPAFRAAIQALRVPNKALALLDALGAQFRQSTRAHELPREHRPDPVRFREEYLSQSHPVVLTGMMADWPALRRWTPQWFAERYGDLEVEITSGRDADADYELHFRRHRAKMRLAEFVHRIGTGGSTNDIYLVAKNGLLERPECAELRGDLECPDGILDRAAVDRRVQLWLGPQGSLTPLHHDACNILFGQVYGAKRVRLIPPYALSQVYNERECFSEVQ